MATKRQTVGVQCTLQRAVKLCDQSTAKCCPPQTANPKMARAAILGGLAVELVGLRFVAACSLSKWPELRFQRLTFKHETVTAHARPAWPNRGLQEHHLHRPTFTDEGDQHHVVTTTVRGTVVSRHPKGIERQPRKNILDSPQEGANSGLRPAIPTPSPFVAPSSLQAFARNPPTPFAGGKHQ
jgi:hypothetical protein